MSLVRRVIAVTHSQYYLAELGALSSVNPEMYRGFNGLISSNGELGIIMTGTESGAVAVSAQWLENEPAPNFDPWDEVVEVSMRFPVYGGVVFGPVDTKADERLIPVLEPGSYRVRVHARGRDTGQASATTEEAADGPVEEHLLLAWPARPAPELVHKLTDAYGAGIRAR
jgi:hypothetical protein